MNYSQIVAIIEEAYQALQTCKESGTHDRMLALEKEGQEIEATSDFQALKQFNISKMPVPQPMIDLAQLREQMAAQQSN